MIGRSFPDVSLSFHAKSYRMSNLKVLVSEARHIALFIKKTFVFIFLKEFSLPLQTPHLGILNITFSFPFPGISTSLNISAYMNPQSTQKNLRISTSDWSHTWVSSVVESSNETDSLTFSKLYLMSKCNF